MDEVFPSVVAVITARPSDNPSTKPPPVTEATFASLELQRGARAATARPDASRP
jgi:hypothetical protein